MGGLAIPKIDSPMDASVGPTDEVGPIFIGDEWIADLRVRASAGDTDAVQQLALGGEIAPNQPARNKFAISVIANGKRMVASSIRSFMNDNVGMAMRLVDPKQSTKRRPVVKELRVRYQKDLNNNPTKSWGEYDDFKRLVAQGYLSDPRDANGFALDLTGSKVYEH